MKIGVSQKGSFDNVTRYLRNHSHMNLSYFNKYGEAGVKALTSATPVDTGLTASSWYYTINNQNGKVSIEFRNSNVNDNVLIAVVLQYGHGTSNGGWVEGQDYINPAIQPIFNNIAEAAWKEVIRV